MDPWTCPQCFAQPWPCSRFDNVAHQVMNAGLRLAGFVTVDLHPRLRPAPAADPGPDPPAPPPDPGPRSETWFDEESRSWTKFWPPH